MRKFPVAQKWANNQNINVSRLRFRPIPPSSAEIKFWARRLCPLSNPMIDWHPTHSWRCRYAPFSAVGGKMARYRDITPAEMTPAQRPDGSAISASWPLDRMKLARSSSK
jgi:hypothetical protein